MTKVEVLVYLWFVHRQCDLYENATRVKNYCGNTMHLYPNPLNVFIKHLYQDVELSYGRERILKRLQPSLVSDFCSLQRTMLHNANWVNPVSSQVQKQHFFSDRDGS